MENLLQFRQKLAHLMCELTEKDSAEIIIEKDEIDQLYKGCTSIALELYNKNDRILEFLSAENEELKVV